MICAVVLAAGRSRRMGAPKMLLPFAGQTVLSHIVDRLLHSIISRVHVIVGDDGDRIAEALAGRSVSIVVNPEPEADMLSSVRCGLKALPPECAAVLVVLGDQPALTTELVNHMIDSFNKTTPGILVPCYRGQRGHPILFSARFFQEVLTRHDETGLRGLLRAHPGAICELEAGTPAVLSDMDTPEDYRRELVRFEQESERE